MDDNSNCSNDKLGRNLVSLVCYSYASTRWRKRITRTTSRWNSSATTICLPAIRLLEGSIRTGTWTRPSPRNGGKWTLRDTGTYRSFIFIEFHFEGTNGSSVIEVASRDRKRSMANSKISRLSVLFIELKVGFFFLKSESREERKDKMHSDLIYLKWPFYGRLKFTFLPPSSVSILWE